MAEILTINQASVARSLQSDCYAECVQWDKVTPEKTAGGTKFTFWRDTEGELEQSATLIIRFVPDTRPPAVQEMTLELASGQSVIPSELKRFAWDRWITAAETIHTTPQPPEHPPPMGWLGRSLYANEVAEYQTALQAAVGHPGSRGRDDAHYQRIADIYRSLLADGERAPIKRLAEDLGVNRHTVSGWVKEARERKFLPDGTKGRAG